jgi:hypothetical protein
LTDRPTNQRTYHPPTNPMDRWMDWMDGMDWLID